MQWAQKQKGQKGFTIVELLIVVVVIAILAAITIVSYNGIQNRAKDSAVQSEAAQLGKKLIQSAVDSADTFPIDKNAFLTTVQKTEPVGTTYDYFASSDQKSFCASVTKQNTSYAFTSALASATPGRCMVNLIPNPDIETSSSGWGGNNVNLARDTTTSNSGSSSLRFRHTGVAVDGYLQMSSNIPVTVGSTYSGTAALRKTDSSSTVSVWLIFYNSSNTVVRTDTGGGQSLDPSLDWKQLKVTATAPANASYARFWIGIGQPGTVAAFYTDSMLVTETSTAYSYGTNSAVWTWNGVAGNSTSIGPAMPTL